VLNLVEHLIEQQVSTPYDTALLLQVAKAFGFARRSKKTDELTGMAVEHLVATHRIKNIGGVLSKA
jgi:hypothetical protein